MQTKPRYTARSLRLVQRSVLSWLKSFPANKKVGIPSNAQKCPLHNYLKAQPDLKRVPVTAGVQLIQLGRKQPFAKWRQVDGGGYLMRRDGVNVADTWLMRFQFEMMARVGRDNAPITAKQAISALYASTFVNGRPGRKHAVSW